MMQGGEWGDVRERKERAEGISYGVDGMSVGGACVKHKLEPWHSWLGAGE